jgi:protein MpaA
MENTTPVNSAAPVKDSLDPRAVVARAVAAAEAAGFSQETFGEAAGCPLVALTRRTPGPRPRLYLSTGIHGDEPAGPLALLEMLEAGAFGSQADWFICPLLNPAGFLRAVRENADGVDLNRDYRNPRTAEIRAHLRWLRRQPNFDATFTVHEDWESQGYYLYEQNPFGRPSLAEPMLAAVAAVCPIDPGGMIDGREARGGIIRPTGELHLRELWPESIYLRVHHTALAYTIEAPSAFPLGQRVAAHRVALSTALRLICGP